MVLPRLGFICAVFTDCMFTLVGILLLMREGEAYFGITSSRPKQFDFNRVIQRQPGDCRSLRLTGEQRRMCNRDPGMGRVLTEGIILSVEECKKQFENERWNCSLDHQPHRINLLREGLKEASFLYAISSAALTTAIAKGCSSGMLNESCTCDLTSFSDEENAATWRWGGCGDNIRYSQMFVKNFLRGKKDSESPDLLSTIDRHNSDLGIRTVRRNFVKKCKCHGVSGACETSTCWRQIKPFQVIGDELKLKYERALRVSVENQANRKGVTLLVKHDKSSAVKKDSPPSRGHMIYRNKSPDFCSRDRYSYGTAGRVCNKTTTCDSICCGRGHNTSREITVTEKCMCTFLWCCNVTCETCTKDIELALCRG
uniref:Protein Wnt n=1 Tax=Holothuria glaberrima TaxID=31192 RepID=C6KJ80_HOLGL|nr:wingless-type [Holothuria glaberrima]